RSGSVWSRSVLFSGNSAYSILGGGGGGGGGGLCAFWFDTWVPGVRFYDSFPRIAAAAVSLETSVADMCFLDSMRRWLIPLSNTLRGGALEEWNQLMSRLDELPEDLITAGPAIPFWPLEASGRFSVRSLRGTLVAERFPGLASFPQEVIWKKGVPTKIQAFCWMVRHSKIASLDNLQRRGFQLANRCVLCSANLESIDHLFLRYEFTMRVWNRISSALSIFGPRGENVNSVFVEWKFMNCSQILNGGSRFVLHAFLWFIWLERNNRIFNDKSSEDIQVFYRWMVAANLWGMDYLHRWNRIIFDPG
ncbi:Putative ribonuclease H protein At1g65750, partial [Linum perenne]